MSKKHAPSDHAVSVRTFGETCTRAILGKPFTVPIQQSVTADDLAWPYGAESTADDLGWNRDYFQLPRFSWRRVRRLIDDELQAIHVMLSVPSGEKHEDDRELAASDLRRSLIGLDLGTNAVVAALRAGRCLPFFSCNAGAFGGEHQAEQPVVSFYCRAEMLPIIKEAARRCEVGLAPSHYGGMSAYAQHVGAFLAWADGLFASRSEISAVHIPRLRPEPLSDKIKPAAEAEVGDQLPLL